MKTKVPVFFLLAILVHGAVYAQEAVLEPKTEGGVTFISGGVGQEETQALSKMEGSYNLRLLFAGQGSGEFLSDVRVRILDAKEKPVLDTVAQGPRFLAKLAPGKYKIILEYNGKQIFKTMAVPAKGAAAQSFYWKADEGQKPQ